MISLLLLTLGFICAFPSSLVVCVCVTALGVCSVRAFSSCSEWGYSVVAVHGFLTEVASHVAEHGPWSIGSKVVAHRPSSSVACGIFPDQGLNPCPLHLAGGFLTTGPQGKCHSWVVYLRFFLVS